MPRALLSLFLMALLPWMGATPAQAETPATKNSPQPSKAEKAPEAKAADPEKEGTRVHWFGHAFIYITSLSGVRVAINPFSSDVISYKLPDRLPAELILISLENADHNGSQNLFGIPQIFRSIAGVGRNNSNGISFRGIQSYRDPNGSRGAGSNTIFVIDIDGIRFCHLGMLGQPLTFQQKNDIGRVDVLFLPVGVRELTPSEILRNAEALHPKIIIPVTYNAPENARIGLRPLSDMDFGDLPVNKMESSEILLNREELPEDTTVLELTPPSS